MLGLIWFTRTVTGGTGLALLPGVAWFAVMVFAACRTGNGSAPVDGMGLITILLGSAACDDRGVPADRQAPAGATAGRPAGCQETLSPLTFSGRVPGDIVWATLPAPLRLP